jgi:peroxiredoxin
MKMVLRLCLILMLIGLPFGMPLARGQFFMENPLVGEKAPDFTLDTLTERSVNLTKLRDGKPAIIFFWATWCPHCRIQLIELNKNAAAFEQKGIKVILVDVGESAAAVKAHMTRYKITLDTFLDPESSLAEPYLIIGVPTFFFVKANGVIKAVEHTLPPDYEKLLF